MRALGKMLLLATLVFAAASIPGGQSPGQPQFGGFGKAKADYFSLLQNQQIKDELKVTNQQVDKLPAAAFKALAEVLDEKQVTRLKQIYLQQRGNAAFLEADVRKDLKITDEQAKKIQDALDTQAKEQQEMFQGGNFDFDRMQELQKTATDAVQAALTAEQKTAWTKMVGETFVQKGLKGFGGFGKKGS